MLGCLLVAQLLADVAARLPHLSLRIVFLSFACFVSMFGSVLTVGRELVSDYQHWSADEVALAQYISDHAEPDALFLTSDRHTMPVFALAGRRILCGSGSYVYYHGMDYAEESAAMRLLYEAPDESILTQRGIDYVLFDASVSAEFSAREDWYAARYPVWYQNESCRIYQITP